MQRITANYEEACADTVGSGGADCNGECDAIYSSVFEKSGCGYLVVHQEGGEGGRGADVRDQLPIRVGHNLDLLDLAKHVENDRRKTEPCAVWVE